MSTGRTDPGRRVARSHRGRPRGPGVLGVLGELLLTAGVLLGLFLVWQLWWTDVMADREQAGILDGLEQEWGAVDEERIAPRQDGPPPVPATPEDTMVFGTMPCSLLYACCAARRLLVSSMARRMLPVMVSAYMMTRPSAFRAARPIV